MALSGTATATKSIKKKRPAPIDIGWREWVRLPALTDRPIRAKVDTGAKTSAIHAYRIEEIDVDGQTMVRFYIHPVQKRKTPEIFCLLPVHDRRAIRSSNGAVQNRYIVRTELMLGDRRWSIDLSLTNRDEMGFRMLIGRDALARRTIIYPGRSYVQGQMSEGK